MTLRVLAGALVLGLVMAGAPAAEAGHRHSRSCDHRYGYSDRYDGYGYSDPYWDSYRYDGHRRDGYRSYRSYRSYDPYRYGSRYYYVPRYGYGHGYGYGRRWYGRPHVSVRIGGPHLGVYLGW